MDMCLDATTEAEVVAYLRSMEGRYDLLAEVFRAEATEELLGRLESVDLPQTEAGGVLAAGFDGLSRFLVGRDVDTIRDLSAEFASLFLGAGVTELSQMASPYESVYTSEDRLLMQDARDRMVSFYRECGVEVLAVGNEPEDHVAFELSFAALLFGRAADQLEASDVAASVDALRSLRRLFSEHLCQWVPWFCTDVIRLATSDFYVAFARILLDAVCGEPVALAFADAQVNPDAAPLEDALVQASDFDDGILLPQEEGASPSVTEEEKRAAADGLFERMGFLKRVFVKTLRFCEQPRTTEEVESFAAEAMRYIRSAYGPADVRAMLHKAYCLERREGLEVGGGQGEPISAVRWETTDIGRTRVEEDDPLENARKLLASDSSWITGYRDTLTTIRNGTGTFKEVEEVIKASRLYQVDNKHASMFLKRLEGAGAIEWQGRWVLTPAGETILQGMVSCN